MKIFSPNKFGENNIFLQGFESTAALRQIYRTDAQINELAENAIRDILQNGTVTTGFSGRYPSGWVTYTMKDGKAAS